MRIAFLVTSPYQLYHYKWIVQGFSTAVDVTVLIEVRDRDFGVSDAVIAEHLPTATIEWIPNRKLEELDGRFDVIVCQTPILPLRFLRRTYVVAQQYSMAKETYQYGLWRAHAHLNLMYGPYSTERVAAFSNAVPVGNPLLDPAFPAPPARPAGDGRRRLLYLPTYGELSSLQRTAPALGRLDADLTVKLHHAEERGLADLLPPGCRVVYAESDPVALFRDADAVISDFSGAAFDALYAGLPVVLVGDPDPSAEDFSRLSAADIDRSLLRDVTSTWDGSGPFEEALELAQKRFADPRASADLRHLFVNPGGAGAACAVAIEQLVRDGEPPDITRALIRETTRGYISRTRTQRTQIRKLETKQAALETQLREINEQRTAASPWRRARARLARVGWLRALLRRPPVAPQASSGGGHSAPDPPSAAATAPDVTPSTTVQLAPARRRRASAEVVRTSFLDAEVVHAQVEVDEGPILAVRDSDLHLVLAAVHALAEQHPELQVRTGTSQRQLCEAAVGDLTLADLYGAAWMDIGRPLELRRLRMPWEGAVRTYLLTWNDRVRRWMVRDGQAPVVDWTAHLPTGRAGDRVEVVSRAGEPTHAATKATTDAIGEIDVVYTWVDSDDPAWREAHTRYSDGEHQPLLSANNAERYLDRDELRYSLRSLELYAPFVRHIYLVTADQVPNWLDLAHPRISVVSHRDIFPEAETLPTFNSHAIEACLHRIPGLSEHYLYLNDDVMLGQEVRPTDLFTIAGLPKVRFSQDQVIYSGEPDPGAIPTDWAAFNANHLIERDFGVRFGQKVKHVPHPQRRSLLEEIEERYAEEVAATRAARFRSTRDLALPSMFSAFYGIASGRAVEWPHVPNEYIYADTGRANWPSRARQIYRKRPQFVCLNVTRHTEISAHEQAVNLASFLDDWLPAPSSFELE